MNTLNTVNAPADAELFQEVVEAGVLRLEGEGLPDGEYARILAEYHRVEASRWEGGAGNWVAPLEGVASDQTPVEQLAEALGWTAKKVYRNLERMPGAFKLDPTKRKSHYDIPDPRDSARRWRAGERKVA